MHSCDHAPFPDQEPSALSVSRLLLSRWIALNRFDGWFAELEPTKAMAKIHSCSLFHAGVSMTALKTIWGRGSTYYNEIANFT